MANGVQPDEFPELEPALAVVVQPASVNGSARRAKGAAPRPQPTAPQLPRPNDPDLELWLLGAACQDEQHVGLLDLNLFVVPEHRALAKALRGLHERGAWWEVRALGQEVEKQDLGALFVAACWAVAFPDEAPQHAERLRKLAIERDVYLRAVGLQAAAAEKASVSQLLELAQGIAEVCSTATESDAALRPLDSLELLTGEPAAVDFLVDQLLVRGDITVLTAPPKSLKSWMGVAIGFDLALGRPVLGFYAVAGPGRVLVVDEENGAARMRRRFRQLVKGAGLDADGIARLAAGLRVYPQQGCTLTSEPHLRAFLQAVDEFKPDLIVLDSWAALTMKPGGSESDNNLRREVYSSALVPARDRGAAVLVLAHPPLPSKEAAEGSQRRPRGGGDVLGTVDAAFYVGGKTEERIPEGLSATTTLGQEFGRDGVALDGAHVITVEDVGPGATVVRSLGGTTSAEVAARVGKTNACEYELLRLLREAPDGEVYQPNAKKALEDAGFTPDTIQSAIATSRAQRLVDLGPPRKGEGSGKWLKLLAGGRDED